MSKFIVGTLSIFLLFGQIGFSMEQTDETSYLLRGARKHNLQKLATSDNVQVVSLITLAPELKELIFSFLPGNNRGLNYLVRWKRFYPSEATIEKIEVAFLQYLIDKSNYSNYPGRMRYGFYMVHFFEHAEYKKKHNKLHVLFNDLQVLDEAIPNPDDSRSPCCIAWSASPDSLDEEEIRKALTLFCKNIMVAWDALGDSVKESVTREEFIKIRKMVLDYFVLRLRSYINTEVITCTLLPACGCCACSGSNVLSGVLIACFVNEAAGLGLALGGGSVCFFLGCMGIFWSGPWNRYNICELIHKDTELEQNQEKIDALERLVYKFQSQINDDPVGDEILSD